MSHWASVLTEIQKPFDVIAEADTGGNWEFDIVAIVRDAAGYHVVSSSGCSCPSFEDRAQYHDGGPYATAREALEWVGREHRGPLTFEIEYAESQGEKL